jgi:GNAT superfamily N-acetyltransferase
MGNPALDRAGTLVVETAKAEDVPAIKLMIDAAYSKYIERFGKLPAAMTADYDKLVETQSLYVLRVGGSMIGSVLLSRDGDSIKVNNLVVEPSAQGRGYSRMLMGHAESMARAQGLAAVTLFTNEKMHENIAHYTKIVTPNHLPDSWR